MNNGRQKYGIKYAKNSNLSMERWAVGGGLDTRSDCVEGAGAESDGGRRARRRRRPGVCGDGGVSATARVRRKEEGRRKERKYILHLKSVNFRRSAHDHRKYLFSAARVRLRNRRKSCAVRVVRSCSRHIASDV
jgi:hypothetical protein